MTLINFKALQEVGDDSNLSKSFDRIRNIIQEHQRRRKEKGSRLEAIVREVMEKQKKEKEALGQSI